MKVQWWKWRYGRVAPVTLLLAPFVTTWYGDSFDNRCRDGYLSWWRYRTYLVRIAAMAPITSNFFSCFSLASRVCDFLVSPSPPVSPPSCRFDLTSNPLFLAFWAQTNILLVLNLGFPPFKLRVSVGMLPRQSAPRACPKRPNPGESRSKPRTR